MKKLLSLVLAFALVMSVMVMPAFAADVEKPEKITIFIDGTVVAVGTPEEVAACERSYTGKYLRPLLEKR